MTVSIRRSLGVLRRRSRMINFARNIFHIVRGRRVALGAWLLVDGKVWLGAGATVSDGARVTVPKGGRFELGPGAWLDELVRVEVLREIEIGARSTVQRGCTLNGDVRIGRGCLLAPNVFISSGHHHYDLCPALPIQEQDLLASRNPSLWARYSRPVAVHDDCWLGTNVVLTPGVTVGRGAVVGANAVVTRDVVPYTIVGGVPARSIGTRLSFVPPRQIDGTVESDRPYFYSGFELAAASAPIADGSFDLALDIGHASLARLTLSNLSGSAVNVVYDGVSLTLGSDIRTTLEFSLRRDEQRTGWLHFEIPKGARVEVHAAEVLGGLSHP